MYNGHVYVPCVEVNGFAYNCATTEPSWSVESLKSLAERVTKKQHLLFCVYKVKIVEINR